MKKSDVINEIPAEVKQSLSTIIDDSHDHDNIFIHIELKENGDIDINKSDSLQWEAIPVWLRRSAKVLESRLIE